MREALTRLLDKPVIIRTVPDDPRWEPTKGIVLEVREDSVDVLTSPSTLKTVRMAAIIDAAIDHRAAQDMILEEPPEHPDYPAAKRKLFEAEQSQLLKQPEATTKALAHEAAFLLRRVRDEHPSHLGTEQMLERAHFLATGAYDYEVEPGVTSGEVDNFNYRWAKERAEKLEEALRRRRPEDEIADHIVRLARYSGRALAKYPAHSELKAWLARAETIRSKLSDEVRRANRITEPFVAGKV
jgi:hypothetical protein